MSILRYGSKRALASIWQRPLLQAHQRQASRVAARIPFTPPSFPTIESCPAPTCQCRETPAGLDIEREQSLNGSMAAYAEQVLISTGKSDWPSKIEDESDAVFLRQMKKFLGRNGKYSDPFHNVLLTNSSIQPTIHDDQHSVPEASTQQATAKPASVPTSKPGMDPSIVPQDEPSSARPASAFLLPTFEYIPTIPLDDSSIETLIKAFILPAQLHAHHDPLTRAQKNTLLREPELRKQFPVRKVNEVLILICGHGGRDSRCGSLGPVLKEEFEEKLERQNFRVLKDAPVLNAEDVDVLETEGQDYVPPARVGLISHIGGHKFAGNVIVYIPDTWTTHPLAGKGIWYGRIEPHHVEGVVMKTVLDGKVIVDHFRGGIGKGGEVMRL